MRPIAQKASYCPDGDGAWMVFSLRHQCGNILNRDDSHVPFSGWIISVPFSVCLISKHQVGDGSDSWFIS